MSAILPPGGFSDEGLGQVPDAGAAAGLGTDGPKKRRSIVLQVLKDRPSAMIGAITVGVIVIIAVFAPLLAPYPLEWRAGGQFCAPSSQHWLGCTDLGRDMITQLMYGARISLIVGVAATAVATVIGGGIGLVSGYYGGGIDIALMRFTDYFLVIPDVPLMIVAAALFGSSLKNIIIIIGILLWTWTARVIRSQVKSVKERVYVKRAKSLGASNFRIIFKHVLPQVMPLLIANTVLTIAVAIFDETALAFLGLGDPTRVSWGTLIESAHDSSAATIGAWWAIIPPGVAVSILCLGLMMWGTAIEDALNPRLKVSHLSSKHFRLRLLGLGSPEAEAGP